MGNRLPNRCPSCAELLHAQRFACPACQTVVEGSFALPVLSQLSEEDQAFAIRFIKSGGSLKDMARQYGVSYPTVRNWLDELIARVNELDRNTPPNEGKEERP